MKKLKIKLIGWDLDGTLADNFETNYQVIRKIFEKFNVLPPKKEEFGDGLTHDLTSFYRKYDLLAAEEEIRDIFREIIEKSPPPQMFDNAKFTLEKIKSQNIEQALITMASGYRVAPFIKSFDIENIFFAIHSDVNNKQKIITKIIQEKNINPEHFLYVGDTPADIEAANSARAISVGFTKGFASKKSLQKARPQFLINDHFELLSILDL